MLMDLQSMFSDQQDFGGDDGTAAIPSTNVIDLGAVDTPKHANAAPTRDLGLGRPIPVLVQVTEDFSQDVGTDFTGMTFTLQVDDDEAFGSPTTVIESREYLLAELVAGKKIEPFYIPEGVNERYMRLVYTPVGGGMDSGKITAGLIFGRAGWTS